MVPRRQCASSVVPAWHDDHMTWTIRIPEAADADACAAVHVSSWRESYGHLLPEDFFTPEYAESRRQWWGRMLHEPPADALLRVGIRDQQIVGIAMAGQAFGAEGEDLPCERQLYLLYALESEYGSGLGQALLDAVLDPGPAMLWVAENNPRAIRFYERNGFTLDGVRRENEQFPLLSSVRMLR